MTRVELYSVSGLKAGRLSMMARPRGGEWLGDEISALRAAGVDVLVSLLTPAEIAELDLAEEAAWCRTHGVDYLSLPIIDRGLPESYRETIALLVRLRNLLLEGKHVAVHCRQGIGRSSLVAAGVLVLLGRSVAEAFDQLGVARAGDRGTTSVGRGICRTWCSVGLAASPSLVLIRSGSTEPARPASATAWIRP